MTYSKQIVHEDARSLFLNYLQLLWFRRRLILVITILAGLLGVAWLSQQTPVYRSTSSLMTNAPNSQAVDIGTGGSVGSKNDLSDEIEVLRSRDLVTKALIKLQLLIYGEFNPSQNVASTGVRGRLSHCKERGRVGVDLPEKLLVWRQSQFRN